MGLSLIYHRRAYLFRGMKVPACCFADASGLIFDRRVVVEQKHARMTGFSAQKCRTSGTTEAQLQNHLNSSSSPRRTTPSGLADTNEIPI